MLDQAHDILADMEEEMMYNTDADSKSETEGESDSDSETEAEANSEAESEAESEVEPEGEVEPELEAESIVPDLIPDVMNDLGTRSDAKEGDVVLEKITQDSDSSQLDPQMAFDSMSDNPLLSTPQDSATSVASS